MISNFEALVAVGGALAPGVAHVLVRLRNVFIKTVELSVTIYMVM